MLLQVEELNSFYGRLQALWGVSLHVEKGEIIALIGSNGAGKSTFLKSIAGSISKMNGNIIFEGVNIAGMKPSKVVKSGIVMSPEGRQIFPRLTVKENLLVGGYLATNKQVEAGYDRAYEMFPVLKERASQIAGTLSGGEQQMLAIGRALMGDPKLLMLDEPSLGLSPLLTETIFEMILKVKEQGVTIILVEQNAVMALSIADRGYVIQNGRIVSTNTGIKLLNDEDIISKYLGKKKSQSERLCNS